jgi:hypothetical protein
MKRMINAEFLAGCSDDQINLGVAWCLAKTNANFWNDPDTGALYKHYKHNKDVERFDPCNDPNDIMPIAFANGIGLIFDDESIKPNWIAVAIKITGRHHEYYDIEVQNTNPLRAICEAYILISVAK